MSWDRAPGAPKRLSGRRLQVATRQHGEGRGGQAPKGWAAKRTPRVLPPAEFFPLENWVNQMTGPDTRYISGWSPGGLAA
jgi:hypothetical protein